MIYSYSKKTIYIFWIVCTIILFSIEFIMIDNSPAMTKFHEFQLLLIYAVSQTLSIKRFGMFNIFSLVLVGFFIFAIGGVFHFFVSNEDILEFVDRGFGDFYFTNSVMQESLLVYTLFIALSFLGYSYFYKKTNSFVGCTGKANDDSVYLKIGKVLMWSFLAIEVYKGYLYFSSFSINRVLIYLYGNMENPVPTWVRFLATFFEMGYAFVLCSRPDKVTFKKYSALFFVVLIPEILLGNRGMFGAYILYYLWYYARFYNPRPISMKYVAVFGIVMLLVFQAMEFMRNGSDWTKMDFSPTQFLKGQAASFYILPIYIQNSESMQYYIYPFVLYNVIGGFSGYTGQSIEVLQHKCGVGHQLMYAVNPNYYLNGGSFGSSNIVELYDLGVMGVVFGALLLPFMLTYFERKFATNRIALFMSYSLLAHFFLSARGSYFPPCYTIFKLLIFYAIIVFFLKSKKYSRK